MPFDATEIVVRGDIAAGKFALFHLTADGTVQAVEAVNASHRIHGRAADHRPAQTSYSRPHRRYVSIDAGTRRLTRSQRSVSRACIRRVNC